MDRRLLLASGAYIDLSEYLLKSEAETLYAPLDAILNKQDKLISGTNIKTVNGNSLLGGGDITISSDIDTSNLVQYDDVFGVKANHIYSNDYPGVELYLDRYGFSYSDAISASNPKYINFTYAGDGTKFLSDDGTYKTISSSSSEGSGAYSEVNHGTSDTTFTLTPNTFHIWDEVASLTLDFGSETSGVANEYLFQFTSGATATTLSLPDDIKWANELAIEPNMIYQISILKGLASVLSWSNPSTSTIIEFFIDSDAFNAEEGMTWIDWSNSSYFTATYLSVSNNSIQHMYTDNTLFMDSYIVKGTDIIEPITYTFSNPYA